MNYIKFYFFSSVPGAEGQSRGIPGAEHGSANIFWMADPRRHFPGRALAPGRESQGRSAVTGRSVKVPARNRDGPAFGRAQLSECEEPGRLVLGPVCGGVIESA